MNLAEMLKEADAATQGVELKDAEFTPIDPGVYTVAVTGAEGPLESKRTNPSNPAEHGQYLKVELTITDGKFANRKVWMNNNIICYPAALDEASQKKAVTAMAMGAKERKVLLDSVGKAGIENAVELVGATCQAQIALDTYDGKTKNVVKSLKPAGAKPSLAAGTPTAAPSAPAVKAKMPWEK